SAGGISFLPVNTLNVTVGGSYNAPAPFAVPTGFQGALTLYPASNSAPPLTVTSKDPARIALTLDPTQKGTGSVTLVGNNRQVWVQALASSGSVELVFSVAGQPDITSTVRITTPFVTLSYAQNTGQPVQLPLGGSAVISAFVGGAD